MYEPKFDGWRAMVFAATGEVLSRRDNDLARRVPEIVGAAAGPGDVVVDGALVPLRAGRLDFGSLAAMPESRASAGVDIHFVAFDPLADGVADLRGESYAVRRGRLAALSAVAVPPLQLAAATADRAEAVRWTRPELAERRPR